MNAKIIDFATYKLLQVPTFSADSNSTYLIKYNHLIKHDDFRRTGDILNGKYQLEGFIGSGGIGMVYLARDLLSEGAKDFVAIKIIKPDILTRNPDQIRFFENEFRTASKLNHPNIVEIFKSDTDDSLRCTYLAMEVIDGISLDEFLSNNRLSIKLISNIFRQICAAVQYSHSQNVLHLDIKPANILLLKNSEDYQVKVIDFGMAKIIASESGTTVTRFGGTPQFCSPEHFVGRKQTKQSDVYSLGATLYNLLTGVIPFGAASYFNAKQFSNLEMPPTPSILHQRPDAPIELDVVIEKAISKNPTARQQSVKELLQDFENALSGKKIHTNSFEQISSIKEEQIDITSNSRKFNLESSNAQKKTDNLSAQNVLFVLITISLIISFWYFLEAWSPTKSINNNTNIANAEGSNDRSAIWATNSTENYDTAGNLKKSSSESIQATRGIGTCSFPPIPTFNPFKIAYENDFTICANPPMIDVAKDTKDPHFAKSMEEYYSIRTFKRGDMIAVRLYILNGANPQDNSKLTMAQNVRITTIINKINDLRYKLSVKFMGDNIASVSGSVTVELEPKTALELMPNTGFFYNLEMKPILDLQEFDIGDSTFMLGELDAGFEYSLFYTYKLKVVGTN